MDKAQRDFLIAEALKKQRKIAILQELEKIDLKSIRSIRDGDTDYVATYKEQANELREELQGLGIEGA